MADKYLNCEAVIAGPFPSWSLCGRKTTAPSTRCEHHSIKRIWPGDDQEAA